MSRSNKQTSSVRFPSEMLRSLVSHYWMSEGGVAAVYPALPDGAVDVVIELDPSDCQNWVYGTTTTWTNFPLDSQARYVGIRFRPGCSRHFIKAAAAELTNRHESTLGLLRFKLPDWADGSISNDAMIAALDETLARYLAQLQPERDRIDEVVTWIESACGQVRVREAAACFGQSERQFERVFLETVGVPAKLFASIVRFRYAARLIRRGTPLAAVAVDAGYTDQSHMSHAFNQLAGISPKRFQRESVEFLQDRI